MGENCDNTRGGKPPILKIKKEKFDLREKKENTLHSLFEVEHFLCDLKNITKGFKLYQIMKK